MYKKILVPVDESEQSYNAVSVAGLIGAATGASLTLLHVRRPAPQVITDMVTQDKLMEMPQKIKEEEIFRRCGDVLSRYNVKADVRSKVSENIAESIIDECRSGNYDAIVMGHRGRRQLKQLLMGSVANGVLVESRCTTIMVHTPGKE